MILPKSFYRQPTLQVAQDLLGCFLVREVVDRKLGKIKFVGKIVETEAYDGPNDLASHASRGKTARNAVMFDDGGLIYVYLVYGMHYMFNIVTGSKGYPAAVLIRALEPISPNDLQTNGPAKLTKAFRIDKSFNNQAICNKKSGLWVEAGREMVKPSQVVASKRIGVDYAGPYKDKLWRFYLKNNPFVSKI